MTALPQHPVDTFPGVARIPLSRHSDDRGSLLPIELHHLPFVPKRVFTVAGASAGTVRGGHGHRYGQQLLICLNGQIDVQLRHEGKKAKVTLVPDEGGLLIGAEVWSSQTYATESSVLMVLASENYDPDSYIRIPEPEA